MADFSYFLKNVYIYCYSFLFLLPLQIVAGILWITLIIVVYTIPYYARYANAYIVNSLHKIFPFIPEIAYPETVYI